MTLPRRLSLLPDGSISQSVISGIEICRGEERKYENIVLAPNKFVEFDGVCGNAVELSLRLELANSQSFTIRVLSSVDDREFTDINIYRNRGKVFRTPDKDNIFSHRVMSTGISQLVRRNSVIAVDCTYSSVDPNFVSRPPEMTEYEMGEDGITTIRIFLDRSVVEAFADERTALSVRAFPTLDSSTHIKFLSRGSESRIIDMRCWQMRSIYETKLAKL